MTALSLENYQALFTEHLLSENISFRDSEQLLQHLVPMFSDAKVKGEEQSQEAIARFSIYRNNVILSLSEAIGDTFPVVKRLIGIDCFNAAAVSFVRKNPPSQPSLLFYGEGFIDYIKTWPACSELSYLTDVARLEWNYIRAFHAADEALLDNNRLAEIAPEDLTEAGFVVHPSVHLMQSQWPVDSIWEENLKDEVDTIDLQNLAGCHLLIYRHQLQVQVVNLAVECFNFLFALCRGDSIADAWSYTQQQQQIANEEELDESELSAMLGYLLGLSIFSDLKLA